MVKESNDQWPRCQRRAILRRDDPNNDRVDPEAEEQDQRQQPPNRSPPPGQVVLAGTAEPDHAEIMAGARVL